MNIYSPALNYLGKSHNITSVYSSKESIYEQLELTPCDLDQIMTRQKQKNFLIKAHPQYLYSLVKKYLDQEVQQVSEEWGIIAGRFESVMEEFQDILHYFIKEVDKLYFPDYLEFVEYEMNMNLIIHRLKNGFYVTKRAIQKDLKRIVTNSLSYNTEESIISKFSKFLLKICEILLKNDLNESQEKTIKEEYLQIKNELASNDKSKVNSLHIQKFIVH